jgi:CBS domain-containing protein
MAHLSLLPARNSSAQHREARPARLTGSHIVRDAIISLAGLSGSPVYNQAGEQVGRLIDVVARLHGPTAYPPVTGLVIRVGHRRSFLDAKAVERVEHRRVVLRTARIDLRDFVRRPGEVLLTRDVLDHQLVDVDGVQVIRAADLYLAPVGEHIRLVGVDVSLATLLRRLGPRRRLPVPTPERVIDWAAIAPFGEEGASAAGVVTLRASRAALRQLRPAELADLLEDLKGRSERQDLLAVLDPAQAADALEEMDPDKLETLLRESEPAEAATLIAAMEPDEAVEALRDLSHAERSELLNHMPSATASTLAGLLRYAEGTAGGMMTPRLVLAHPTTTVAAIRTELARQAEHQSEIGAVTVVDGDGTLIADIPLFDLLLAGPYCSLSQILAGPGYTHPPVTVSADADMHQAAARLVDSRTSSLVVVDADMHPIGRILADDVVDTLLPRRTRFPRLLP